MEWAIANYQFLLKHECSVILNVGNSQQTYSQSHEELHSTVHLLPQQPTRMALCTVHTSAEAKQSYTSV